ncbi:hypothetical protein [Flaviaesturariibacter amylovorans]|uniref:MerR family transcriptional regulator n=1 Tax=Flaviaesturariibacter amylovorans TaxID=1084520 RepID=A0ABP8H505_9BACT
MSENASPIDHILNVGEQEYTELAEMLYQKDYATEALSFIDNHARILHYWKVGAYNLLPDDATNSARRRYSFLDLIWLGIVKELRDFGMEKEAIAKLKNDLLDTSSTSILYNQINQNPAEIKDALQKQLGLNSIQVNAMLEVMLSHKDEVLRRQSTYLLIYVKYVLTRKSPLYLLVGKDGSHVPFEESTDLDHPGNQLIKNAKRSAHISLCINKIVGFFLAKEFIQEKILSEVYTKEERKILELIRSEMPRSITVHFKSDGKMKQVEITHDLKVNAAARLSEIILAGGYEKIEIITENGKPVACKKIQKHKL